MERLKFRRCLSRIANRLSNQDFDHLKFLCGDVVPVARMERVRVVTDLFQALEERGKMSVNDLGYLAQLLATLGRAPLLEELTNEGFDVAGWGRRDSGGVTSNNNNADAEREFHVCLLRIAQGLTSSDVESLLYVWSDVLLGMSSDRVYSATQLFRLLEQRRHISAEEPRKLYDELHEIGRSDLCRFINEYLRKLGRATYDMAPAEDERPYGQGEVACVYLDGNFTHWFSYPSHSHPVFLPFPLSPGPPASMLSLAFLPLPLRSSLFLSLPRSSSFHASP